MPLDLQGHALEELRAIFRSRTHGHFHGANRDLLFDLANHNQELLKPAGDHVVYHRVIDDFAAGLFSESDSGTLLYKGDPVRTVESRADGTNVPIPL